MATFKSAAVEEFFNRVHSPADGKFSTSGTGGGHYKGRGAGKAAPKGSGGASKAAAPAPKGGGGKLAPPEAWRRRMEPKNEPANPTAKAAAPSKPAAETSAQRVARIQAVRTAAKARGSKAPVPANKPKAEDKDDNTLNAIAKIKATNQNAPKPAGPKPTQNKQDSGQRTQAARPSAPVKAPKSNRVSNFLSKASKALDSINPSSGIRNLSTDKRTADIQRAQKRDKRRDKETKAYNSRSSSSGYSRG